MINDEVLIKFARNHPLIVDNRIKTGNWPGLVRALKESLYNLKYGFPGINNDCLSLVKYSDISAGDIIIHSDFPTRGIVETTSGEFTMVCNRLEVPVMLEVENNEVRSTITSNIGTFSSGLIKGEILGFGYGLGLNDANRRRKLGSQYTVSWSSWDVVVRVDCIPKETGGAGYYYFFKSYRDFRL